MLARTEEHWFHVLERILIVAALLALIFLAGGCSLFYDNQHERDECTVYSDLAPNIVRPVGFTVAKGMQAYWELFDTTAESVPPPTVVYAEPERSQRKIFTRELRQEGFYLPMLNLVHLSPQLETSGYENRDTVILHELCHHFLVSLYPDTASQYWLNEGLACALELSFFQGSELETPLYHPTLHRHSRQALFELGSLKVKEELRELVEGSWLHFHHSSEKTRHYALSWALVYTLLHPEKPLSWEQRLHSVLHFDPADFDQQFDEVLKLLRRSPASELDRIAQSPKSLHWALKQWVQLDHPLDRELESHLSRLLDHTSVQERCFALQLLTGTLNQRLHKLPYERVRALRARVAERLRIGTDLERVVICDNLREGGRHASYYATLVELLEWHDPSVRVAAAGALSRISHHPTITNPNFWRSANTQLRHAEIASWHRWLRSQQLSRLPKP